MELDVDHLKKMSTDYAVAKELAIKGSSDLYLHVFYQLLNEIISKT